MYRIYGILLCLMIIALSSTACTKSNSGQEVKQSSMKAQAYPSTNKKVSEDIKKEISKVKGIKKASVIVHNKDAIIGLDVKKDKDKKSIEQKVKKAVEKTKPAYKVHVTAEKTFHDRVQRIQTNMVPLDGHPFHNFSEDVGILIEDMTNMGTRR